MSYAIAVYVITVGSLVGYGIQLLSERASLLRNEEDAANGDQ